jgi:hypothetical protein
LALIPSWTIVSAAYKGYTDLDQIGNWKIERKVSEDGGIRCRAYLANGGSWFGANIHLNQSNQLVIPSGRKLKSYSNIDVIIKKLDQCRNDFLYMPSPRQ